MAYIVMTYTGGDGEGEHVVMAYIVTAYIGMAYIVTAYIVMAYIVTAYIVTAYIVMAYIVTAYIVMAYTGGDGEGEHVVRHRHDARDRAGAITI